MLQGFALLVFAGILLILSLSLLSLSLSVSSYLSFLLFSLSDCFFIYLSLSLFFLFLSGYFFLTVYVSFYFSLSLCFCFPLSLYSAWAFLKKIFFNSSEGRRSNRLLYGNPPTTPVDVVVKGETLLANEKQLLTWLKCFKLSQSKKEAGRRCSMNFALNERTHAARKERSFGCSGAVWPDWAIYNTLGNFSKPVATISFPICTHF